MKNRCPSQPVDMIFMFYVFRFVCGCKPLIKEVLVAGWCHRRAVITARAILFK